MFAHVDGAQANYWQYSIPLLWRLAAWKMEFSRLLLGWIMLIKWRGVSAESTIDECVMQWDLPTLRQSKCSRRQICGQVLEFRENTMWEMAGMPIGPFRFNSWYTHTGSLSISTAHRTTLTPGPEDLLMLAFHMALVSVRSLSSHSHRSTLEVVQIFHILPIYPSRSFPGHRVVYHFVHLLEIVCRVFAFRWQSMLPCR